MIQMLRIPPLQIPMPPSRNMKIPLHLIQLQTPINATTIRLPSPGWQLRRLSPLRFFPPQRNNIMHMFLAEPLILDPPFPGHNPPLHIPPQPMHALAIHPLHPHRRIACKSLGR